ncbi:MAG: hypothetical protein ACYDAR_19365, partial [Thermomicrobiales bacterium]
MERWVYSRIRKSERPAGIWHRRLARWSVGIIIAGVLSALIAPVVVRADITINVLDGDVAGLKAAINTANANLGTAVLINLASNGSYNLAVPSADDADGRTALPPVQSGARVFLYGRGATLTATTPMRIFKNAGGTLSLDNLTLRDGTAMTSAPTGNGLGGAIL